MKRLCRDDLEENIATIKINKSYKENMSELELYDITRGCWRRKIESLKEVEYVLAVVFGEVKEVYQVMEWLPAAELKRETIPFDAAVERNRIGFAGYVAPNEIRRKYRGKSVADLYKKGEANPVKVFLKEIK